MLHRLNLGAILQVCRRLEVLSRPCAKQKGREKKVNRAAYPDTEIRRCSLRYISNQSFQ